jgi:hypothetical protein
MFDFWKKFWKRLWNTGKSTVSWTNQQLSGWYDSLSNAISLSTKISRPTGDKILRYVSSAIEASKKHAGGAVNLAAITTTAILASDFSRNMTSWLEDMLNNGVPSIYDKSVDAVYNATNIGGGHLHRLFDGSHDLWGMWEKVREASPDDTLLQEAVGYTTALSKDIATHVGIPLFTWSKSSYDQVTNSLSATFGIPKPWCSDLLHVNAVEIIGTSIGTLAVALNWNSKQAKEFASLAGSLGISSIVSANPALGVVTLVALSKSYIDAGEKGDYMEIVNGLSKGGVGTGVFLAASSVIGGPVWVGILAGMCVGVAVNKTMDTVDISQITDYVNTSLRKATE